MKIIFQGGFDRNSVRSSDYNPQQPHQPRVNPRQFLPTYSPVTSTEVAHSLIVGRAVEKSASLPGLPPGLNRVVTAARAPRHPARGRTKIFLEKEENFRPPKKCPPDATIYRAIHHNFTTIYHHKTPQNCQDPLQKRLFHHKDIFF
jgi:hypothetical protein